MILALATLVLALWSATPAWAQYYSTNLSPPISPPPGDIGPFQPMSLTASGGAYGTTYFEGAPDPTPPFPVAHVGSWANGTFTDQGAMPATFAYSGGTGQLSATNGDGYYYAYGDDSGRIVADTRNDVFMLSGGALTAIPSVTSSNGLVGSGSYANAISNGTGGWVVGYSGGDNVAFAYNATSNTTYKFGAAGAQALAVTNSGEAVGYDSTGAFSWSGGTTTYLTTSTLTEATAISNSGKYVVGANQNGTYFNPALPSEGGGTHPLLQPVVYNTATATPAIINTSAITFPLGMPNTDGIPPSAPTGTSLVTENSYALYVNNSGEVVGQTDFQLWEPGFVNNVISIGWMAMPGTGGTYQPAVALSSLVPASVSSAGYNDFPVAGLNDQGQILLNAMGWTYGIANGQSYVGPISSAPEAALLLTPWISGDANLDGQVDINDLTIVLSHYDQTGMGWSQGEFTGDGTVDINDLTIVLAHYGQTAGASAAGVAAVPEPAALLLAASGLLGLLAWAWRKRK
jgi:hypothetical protein